MQYAVLILAAILLGLNFATNKIYQKTYGATLKASAIFNILLGLFSFVIFYLIGGFKLEITCFSAAMAALFSLLSIGYTCIGFCILKLNGSIAVYTMYLMTGGMVLPYVYGIFFMDEPLKIIRTVGLVVIMLGIVVLNISPKEKNKNNKVFLLCALVFLLNGLVSIISKIHQTESVYECVSSMEFVALSGLFKFTLAAILLCLIGRKEKSISLNILMNKNVLIITAASAVLSGTSYFLQLLGAKTLPTTVLYPFITGGSIVCSSVTDLIVFKEKISAKIMLSIALCFLGTLLFL